MLSRILVISVICFFIFINNVAAETIVPPGVECSNPDAASIDMSCSFVFQEQADKELNEVYNQLLAKLDEEGRSKLIASERAWIKFRDADVSLVVHHYGEGGSLGRAIAAQRSFEMTRDRIKDIRKRLENDAEW